MSTLENKSQLENLSFIKTVLMILVILDHSVAFWTGGWFTCNPALSAPFLGYISSFLGMFHIYAFVFVSGYLFYYLKFEKGQYRKYIPFVVNKAKRLLIPYAFISLIWAIPFAVAFNKYDIVEILKRYALGIAPSQLWFLLMLFIVFAVFYPLSNFFAKKNVLGLIVVLAVYASSLVLPSIVPNIFQIFRACSCLPLFWLGFKIRQYDIRILKRIPALIWVVVCILLFVLYCYLKDFQGIIFTLLRFGLEFVLHIVGTLMAFYGLQKIADFINKKAKKARFFSFISRSTMIIYLFHQQIIYLTVYWLNGYLNPYLHALVNFVTAITISLLIAFLMGKFKWTRFLVGEK